MSNVTFTGKVAVITGGNSGIGLATAKLLAERGARVAITGRDPKTIEQASKEIGNGVLAVRADVSDLKALDGFYAEVAKKFGKIDILFANAGVAKFAPVADTTEALFDEIFDINVKGLYFTIQKALPHFNDGGSIIINASVAGQIGFPTTSVYSATKAAVRSFARTIGAEVVGRNIRVNVVSPGPIETPILGRLGLSQQAADDMTREMAAGVPMKRLGTANEVAEAVLFLASPGASYITGVDLNVDGGMGQI